MHREAYLLFSLLWIDQVQSLEPFHTDATCDDSSCWQADRDTLESCHLFFISSQQANKGSRWFSYNEQTKKCLRCKDCSGIKMETGSNIYFSDADCEKNKGEGCSSNTCCMTPFSCVSGVCHAPAADSHPLCFGARVGNLGPSWVERDLKQEAEQDGNNCNAGYCGSSSVPGDSFDARFPMHGSGVAIISFSNGNVVDGTVQLKLVSGSTTEDLVTAEASTKYDVVFPYNDGDEVVLTETDTGKIVVHSLECADHDSEFQIINGATCEVNDKEFQMGSIGELKGVTHKKQIWGQSFWEHLQMTPKLCSTLCARTADCLGFSQRNSGDGNLGSCNLFSTVTLTLTKKEGASCGLLASALAASATSTTMRPSTFIDRLTKQWGGWVGISIIVAVTSIVFVVMILCATCCIYALCRRCAKKRNAHRNPAPVHAIPAQAPKRLSSTPIGVRSPEGYPRADLRDLHHQDLRHAMHGPPASPPLALPAARRALPVMHENSQFEAPLNPDEEMIRDHINRLKLEIKSQNEHKMACETSGQYEEAERTAARIWQLEERLDRSEEKLFMLIENNADADDMHPGNSRNSMPMPPHQTPPSPYIRNSMSHNSMPPDSGAYSSSRDDDKTINNINQKLEQLQMKIKHAQTEEEADRCEAEIWELLNTLKEENDNLKLERTVDLTQPTQHTDEYADPTRSGYQSTPLLHRDRQSYAEPPLQHNDGKPVQQFEAGAHNPWAAESAGMMHGRGMMMQRDSMSHGGVMRRDMGPFAGRGALRRDAASYGGMQHDPAAFRASRKMHPDAGAFHTMHAGMHPETRPFSASGMMHPDAGSFHSTHSGQMAADPQSFNSHHPPSPQVIADGSAYNSGNLYSPYSTGGKSAAPPKPHQPPPSQPRNKSSPDPHGDPAYVMAVAKQMYGLELTARPNHPPVPLHLRTIVSSNYLLYNRAATAARSPERTGVLLFAVDKLINSYCRRHRIDGTAFAQELTSKTLAYQQESGDHLSSAGMYLWTSVLRLPDDNEFCSVLNESLRIDDCEEVAHAVVVCRTIVSSIAPFQIPSSGCCWRGAGFDNRYKDFFVQGKRFRVPGVFSASKRESMARRYMNRVIPQHARVLFKIFFDEPQYLGNVQHYKNNKSGKKSVHEYLFAPYSCFFVPSPPQWSPDPSEPHLITLSMDNRTHVANSITASGVVVAERDNTPVAPWY